MRPAFHNSASKLFVCTASRNNASFAYTCFVNGVEQQLEGAVRLRTHLDGESEQNHAALAEADLGGGYTVG